MQPELLEVVLLWTSGEDKLLCKWPEEFRDIFEILPVLIMATKARTSESSPRNIQLSRMIWSTTRSPSICPLFGAIA